MKIGVISDTHSREIPPKVLEELRRADMIVHAGDFCAIKDYKMLERLGKVVAVYGNMDEPSLAAKLPEQTTFEVEGVTIGVYHGAGPGRTVLNKVKEKFFGQKVNVVIFGHSHQALNEQIGKVLYFNPGSPNDLCAAFCSYGILDINAKKVSGKIIKL